LLGRVVAIKVLRPEIALHPQFAGRFLQEAKAAAEIDKQIRGKTSKGYQEVGATATTPAPAPAARYSRDPPRPPAQRRFTATPPRLDDAPTQPSAGMMDMRYDTMRTMALALVAAGSLLGSACGDDSTPPAADSTSSGDDTGTTTNVSATSQSTSATVTTTTGADSTTGMADGSFLDPSTSTGTEPPNPQPNGSQCTGPDDCETMFCYEVPMFGGLCSECLTDEDCGKGTCSIDLNMGYAICTDGSLGVMCSTDEGCMGDLVCSELVNTGGIFPANFCSECRDDDVPCAGGDICSPVYDLENIAGYMGCVTPGSVENGGGCPLNGVVGDGTVCMSGACGVAQLFGLIPIGICGECVDDADCVAMGLTTCEPAVADMSGVTPATCI
ncbi:MAG: hypothetical protein KDK70_12350, partial [Myxococcales bacterium]|nr:hypothetical protein [Myxococcales bacterium]